MKRLFVLLQYLLPHHWLCAVVYRATRSRRPWLKNRLIGRFVQGYAPDMSQALERDPLRYASFNDFFTRALAPGARPADPDPASIDSPCDGTLSVASAGERGQLLQAKGHAFSVTDLLGGRSAVTAELSEGLYTTIYLAPFNYHRIHMPLDGTLREAWHVAGRLFSVNAATVARVPGLFARNERVVCVFEGAQGPFVVVLVGALFVGSMSTVWHGEVTPHPQRAGVRALSVVTTVDAHQRRGAELGRFNMGSTVILLLPRTAAHWDPSCQPGRIVRVGTRLGTVGA